MKKFVTIFLRTENVHLLKDVGAIPYTFAKYLGYESTLVCIRNGEYPYNEQYTKGLKLEFIEGDMRRSIEDAWYEYRLVKQYIAKHAKEIDVLNLYHYSTPHLLLLLYYKLLNPKGIAYLKLDADFNTFPLNAQDYAAEQHDSWKDVLKRWLLKKVDVISAESREICDRASCVFGREITYIPNGFFAEFSHNEGNIDSKGNSFLTVGRLGSYQKNAESILRAFAGIYRKCDWNLILVGPVEGQFLSVMEDLFTVHEGLEQRVIYKGSVSDKTELSRIYNSAKVFLLPSRWESFGLVVVEAQSAGCYLILSQQVVPYAEFTDNGRLGDVIVSEDDNALADAMLRATKMEHDYLAAKEYAYTHFTWERICCNLNRVFLEIRKEAFGCE